MIDTEIIKQVERDAELLVPAADVDAAFDRMAREITEALHDANPIILCVMIGGMIPTGHLLTRMHFPLQVDYVHVTRYHKDTRAKDLIWVKTPSESMIDRTVLVIDDILDEGLTLDAIVESCKNSGASRVLTAVLVDKQRTRSGRTKRADFTGLEVANRYVYGYGMDYKSWLRNAPGIYAVKDL